MPPTIDAPDPMADPREPAEGPGPPRAGSFRLRALAVAAVALAVRAIHLLQLRSSPFFGWLVGDPEGYHVWALAIANGDWLGDRVFYQAPLYPYFLGVLYRLLGADPGWVRFAQIGLGAASCVLLALGTRRLFGDRAGLAAGLLLALYPPALFFEVLLQKSALDVFLLTLLLALVARAWRGGTLAWLAAGAAGGALALTRENAVVLLVGLGAWLLLDRSRGVAPVRLREAAALALGAAILVAPVALRNLRVGGELVVTTSQLGPNLWYGNGPRADGTYRPFRPGRGAARWEQADARRLAEAAEGRVLSPAEVSSHWARRTLEHVRERPGRWLRLTARKLRWTLASLELMDTEDQYTYREWAPVAGLLGAVLHFGVLAPLAVLGAFATRRRTSSRLAGLLALWIGLYAASVVAFYVVDRYRLPLAVLAMPFAAAGIAGASGWVRRAGARERVAAALLVATTALVANWPVRAIGPMRAQTYTNIGAALAGSPATLALAEAALERALEESPGFAPARQNLGVVYARSGRRAEAVASFERALALGPETTTLRRDLAFNLAEMGRWAEAEAAYERAVELEPEDVATIVRLGIVRAEAGDVAGAAAAFERALGLDPDNAAAQENLERASALLGRGREAPPAER